MALELQAGDTYGEYRILDVLGKGGFSWVYLVRTHETDELLALKLSRDPIVDVETARRTMREFAVLKTLTNPHVVRVMDSGVNPDGHAYILMEKLEGSQLDHAHAFDQPMHPPKALRIVHQACMGLAEAHAHGIVHRDIKPENIWVTPDGSIKVIDFGLARGWAPDTTIGVNATVGRMVIGTPHYTQPEQLQTDKLTPASDVFSLGTILYELLCGHTVYFPDRPLTEVREQLRDDPVAWLNAHARSEIVPITRYPAGRELPRSLVNVIERALAKDPAERPQDAGALANELGQILHYDYGVMVAATLRVTHPYGGYEDQLLLPGSHRIGSGPRCEVKLGGAEVARIHAILEWRGLPSYPQLRPLRGDGSVRVGDDAVLTRTQLGRDDVIHVGPYKLELLYPTG